MHSQALVLQLPKSSWTGCPAGTAIVMATTATMAARLRAPARALHMGPPLPQVLFCSTGLAHKALLRTAQSMTCLSGHGRYAFQQSVSSLPRLLPYPCQPYSCCWERWHAGRSLPGSRLTCVQPNAGDVIGVLFNRVNCCISFLKNGIDLGVAFADVPLEERLYPCVGLRTPEEEVPSFLTNERLPSSSHAAHILFLLAYCFGCRRV